MLLATVEGELAEAALNGPRRAVAPCCGEPVVAKTGSIVSAHWAHMGHADCDPWSEPESEWHLGWKRKARALGAAVEVPFRVDGKIVHRADIVLADGRIVEVQRSALSIDKRREREEFYGSRGGMFWVLDGSGWDVRPRDVSRDPFGDGPALPWLGAAFAGCESVVAVMNRHRVTLDCRAPQALDFGDGLGWKRKAIHVRAYSETWLGLAPATDVLASPGPAYTGGPRPAHTAAGAGTYSRCATCGREPDFYYPDRARTAGFRCSHPPILPATLERVSA